MVKNAITLCAIINVYTTHITTAIPSRKKYYNNKLYRPLYLSGATYIAY